MSYVIYKYQIEIQNFIKIDMPLNAKILAFQMQNNVPVLWAMVDVDQLVETREFIMIPTGVPIPNSKRLQYIGTIQDSLFVGHLFECL